MKRFCLVVLFGCFFCVNSCNDGDVIDFEFDFEDTFRSCGESNILLFKTKEDPTETVSVAIEGFTVEDIFKTDSTDIIATIEKTGVFTYRTYNRLDLPDDTDLFCNNLPPANLNITLDESSDAKATIIRSLIEDDNDGIPAEFENQDPNGDGDFSDAQDTDGDGIPDYLDADDDGDNVLTSSENVDPDNDDNPADAQDTDGDGTPDYLDPDDDGDGVLTRDEENDTQNQNPQDDVSNSVLGIADYLNENVNLPGEPATAYRPHTINQIYIVRLIVEEIDISFLSQDIFDFGTLTGASQLSGIRTVTPDFP
ncbi:MAG: hypothetical protein ACON5F_05990 [Jejuia sp.]